MKSRLTINDLIQWGNASSALPAAVRKAGFAHIGTDSRKIGRGDIFVALATERDDGHRYVEAALAAGAVAAIVDVRKTDVIPACHRKNLIKVKDPLAALQRMAAKYRRALGLRVIAITGSSGKTTTRNFVTEVLRRGLPTGGTEGNLNNHIGVPLSLLSLRGDERVAVIEMGANHAGEIHGLSLIARPDVGVITNIGYAHVGNFGSLAGTTSAKFEIADGLDKRKGYLLLNGDDPRLRSGARGIRAELFGMSARCSTRATDVELTADLHQRFKVDGHQYELPMAGRHFIYAALPAIHLGLRAGMQPETIADVLRTLAPASMRGGMVEARGMRFIVDCYNANPSSMRTALDLLADAGRNGPLAAIVGDMLELGRYSRKLHQDLGSRLARAGVARVIAVGSFAEDVAKGARSAGMGGASIATVADSRAAAPVAAEMLRAGDTVLVKGSRGVYLETVLEELRNAECGMRNEEKRRTSTDLPQGSGRTLTDAGIPARVSILGAARSGLAAAQYLTSHGVSVFISDTCPEGKLREILAASGLAAVAHEAGAHTDRVLEAGLIVISPGVPSDIPVVKRAHERSIPVWSEIELACRLCPAPVYTVTGSSGKSTTVSLMGEVFKASGAPTIVAGNIGAAAMGAIADAGADTRVVLEVSSFQLENIDRFRPRGAAVLNLMKNHLDRYASEEEYYQAKMQIARNMRHDDVLVVNAQDSRLVSWATDLRDRVTVAYFGEGQPSADGVWYDRNACVLVRGAEQRRLFDVASMKIRGRHNYLNAAAAAAVAIFAGGVSDEAVRAGVAAFPGLPHRLELAGTLDGVGYYNDSKSTTAESIVCAMQAFDRGVHLIAGGRDKGCDFSLVNDELIRRGAGVYLIGEAADRIASIWQGLTPIRRAPTLEAAVAMARANARPGDAVVLSPGCSSFDMFRNYEERGASFKSIVAAMARSSREEA